jgi:hypothetical protein
MCPTTLGQESRTSLSLSIFLRQAGHHGEEGQTLSSSYRDFQLVPILSCPVVRGTCCLSVLSLLGFYRTNLPLRRFSLVLIKHHFHLPPSFQKFIADFSPTVPYLCTHVLNTFFFSVVLRFELRAARAFTA